MSKWAFIENIVWAVGSMSLTAFLFHLTGSWHSLWPLVIAMVVLNNR